MILKLLLIIAVISVVYFIFIKKKPDPVEQSNKKADADDMIECAHCGVYAELQESILSNGKYYCSQECLQEAK